MENCDFTLSLFLADKNLVDVYEFIFNENTGHFSWFYANRVS